MRNNPLIFAGCVVNTPKGNPARSKATTVTAATPPLEATEYKGGFLIRDLWENGTDSVHGMRVVNIYAKSHSENTPEKFLQEAEQAKKNMYLDACLQQRRNFSPFVSSVNVLMGVEATATLKRIANRLAKKWRNPNLGRVDMSRVGSPSLWCGPHTGVSGGPGCRRKILVSSACSGKTAPG